MTHRNGAAQEAAVVGKFLLGMVSGGLLVTGGLVVASMLAPARPANDNAPVAAIEEPIAAPKATAPDVGDQPAEPAALEPEPAEPAIAEPAASDTASEAMAPAVPDEAPAAPEGDAAATATAPEAPAAEVAAPETVAKPSKPAATDADTVATADPAPKPAAADAADTKVPTAEPAKPAETMEADAVATTETPAAAPAAVEPDASAESSATAVGPSAVAPAPAEPAPADTAMTDAAPEAAPEAAPVETAALEPAPAEPPAAEPAPAEPAPAEPAVVEPALPEANAGTAEAAAPAQDPAAEPALAADSAPAVTEPATEAPAVQAPAAEVPAVTAEPAPAAEAPVATAPEAEAPAPAAEAPAEEAAEVTPPAEPAAPDIPTGEVPAADEPVTEAPAEATPADAMPAPADAIPGAEVTDMPGTKPATLPGVTEPAETPAIIVADEKGSSTFKPVPGLIRSGEGVIIGRDKPAEDAPIDPAATPVDQRPIAQFSADFDNPDAKPPFAIVLVDPGTADLDRAGLAALPFPVSFALDPLDPATAERAAIYRAAGKEVVMLVTGIATGAQASDVEVAFQSMEQGLPEAVAAMDLAAPTFQNNRGLSTAVVPILKAQGRGLLTWDEGLNAADQVARRDDLEAAVVFRNLDQAGGDKVAVRRLLDRAVFKADQDGKVSVVGTADPATVAALLEWTVEGKAATVALAPLTAVLKID